MISAESMVSNTISYQLDKNIADDLYEYLNNNPSLPKLLNKLCINEVLDSINTELINEFVKNKQMF